MTGKSAIAVETIVAVVEAAATVPPVPMRNSEYAIHRADCTTDPGADCAAHDGTDRSCRAAAPVGAFLRAADDPLRMAEMGHGKKGQHESRNRKLNPEGRVEWQRRRLDLRLLLLKSSFARNSRGQNHLTPTRPKSCATMTDLWWRNPCEELIEPAE
jgi:hypothetical protein